MTGRVLLGVIIASVLMFGAVEVWSSTVVLTCVLLLGLIWTIGRGYDTVERAPDTNLLLGISSAFVAYGLIQLMPMPEVLLRFIAPSTHAIREFYSTGLPSTGRISLVPHLTALEAVRYGAALAVFAIVATLPRERLREWAKVLIVFGFCLAVFGLLQKATWNGRIYWLRELTQGGTPFGPFVNRNHFAGLAGMIVPLGLGVALTTRQKDLRILYGFMSVITAVGLFFSLSRGGIVSFSAAMALFAVLMAARKGANRVWIVAVFLTVLAGYLLYLNIDPIIARFYQTDITKEERLLVWAATWDGFRDFWSTGAGLGSFMNVYPLYAKTPIRAIYDHAHNDYLEFLLETGVVGGLFLISFTVALIWGVVRKGISGRDGMFRIAALSAVCSMGVHSVFDFNLRVLSNLLVFAAVLGMAAWGTENEPAETPAALKTVPAYEREQDLWKDREEALRL